MRGLKTRFGQRVAVVAAATAIAGVGSLVSAGLIPGGGPRKSDCYVELSVQNIDSPGPDVKGNRTVRCVEGDACDGDGTCGNESCTFRVAVCIDQQDPNLPQCTPASSLSKLKVNGKILGAVPASRTGSACGSFVDLTVPLKKGGKKAGMVALPANATAEKGTNPARDRDKYVLQCLPRTAPCPGPTTTTTTLPGSIPTVTVGPGGDLRFEPATITVHAGDTVRWHWGSSGHNVVSGSGATADGTFCSPSDQNCGSAPLSNSGTTYEHTFTTPGTFPYFCSVHQSFGMTGEVVVQP
jgi:plastocyanin